jgi:hypothetical protein
MVARRNVGPIANHGGSLSGVTNSVRDTVSKLVQSQMKTNPMHGLLH